VSGEIQIQGGAGPEEAAVIAAVVERLLIDEAAAMATPATPPRQSAWVQSRRPREIHAPLPSHVYDAQPWQENTAPE
jgi:hypothetical protein